MDIHRIATFVADNIFQVIIQFVLSFAFKAIVQIYNNHRRKKLK